MENKIQLKKAIIISTVIFLSLSIVFGILNYLEYKKYTQVFNEKILEIASRIKEKYPEIETREIVKILNSSSKKEEKLLRNFGIDINNENAIIENDKNYNKFIICEIAVIAVLFILEGLVFLIYNNRKDKRLNEITQYIEEINRRNYKLDIEDNTEDELSILKNEVYKTTVMLKEVAENSVQDKRKLKDSLSDISHQLKTPLTSITIMLDNMLEDKEMEAHVRTEFIKDIKREVANINFLVGTLLKLSKFDANTINFINKEENIREILETAVKNVASLCDLKNIKIELKGKPEEKLYCDFKWQVEAITNVLKNCAEHSSENSIIEIEYSKNNLYSKIEIKDYGSGIDKEDLPHIFERFYKGKNSNADSVRYRSST